ncbi:hypothetical protein Xen7305DRAFT_00001250 [Xenococcus sp. PCC 7305]|uniref:hypothetical protein n=1 Tax=Xenococcus sp. PCC 7305 TaxID=102125 RepID=UPI0002AC646F|nr:hypothetical protein [Xenococcus sp. PCC 7305]ELS00424.1 hypothetical protein Xen7305DRAFT_00001250 [Xenococcus sp. PCC 7305]
MNQNSVNTAIRNGDSPFSSLTVKFNVLAILSLLIVSCSNSGTVEKSNDTSNASDNQSQSEGTLNLVANGEDFVRQGFVTKDGWTINFDRLDVNLAGVTAYQMTGAFEPTEIDTLDSLNDREKIALVGTPQVVDLAKGEADAEPILVTNAEVTPGFYNAVAWQIDTAEADSPLVGKTMVMQGTATKDNRVVNFDISLNRPIQYLCGEYVGDERKGIVQAGETGEVETTFHFDHIFGDGETSADDTLNVDALGFAPLAQLASGDRLTIDDATLSEQLSPEDQKKLTKAVIGLGHVGEGHCAVIQ